MFPLAHGEEFQVEATEIDFVLMLVNRFFILMLWYHWVLTEHLMNRHNQKCKYPLRLQAYPAAAT